MLPFIQVLLNCSISLHYPIRYVLNPYGTIAYAANNTHILNNILILLVILTILTSIITGPFVSFFIELKFPLPYPYTMVGALRGVEGV